MRWLLLCCLFLCLRYPALVSSCRTVATAIHQDSGGGRSSPVSDDLLIHWSCNGCDSKFGCCNLIQFTKQLARAKKDVMLGGGGINGIVAAADTSTSASVASCVEQIAELSAMEGAFSLVSYYRAIHPNREQPHHHSRRRLHNLNDNDNDNDINDDNDDDAVVQQYRNGRWNRTILPQFDVEPILPYKVMAHFDLSTSGGMHRVLSINLNLIQVTGIGSISMLLVLTEDFFVDIEHLIHTPCHGDFQSCHVTIHSSEIINTEEPAFVSPQHAIRLDILWNTPLLSMSMEESSSLSFALSIHARYPKPISRGRGGYYVVAKLPAPILLGVNGSNLPQPLPPPLVAHIPAGHADDGTFVTLATALCSIVGSLLLLRDLSRVSRWN